MPESQKGRLKRRMTSPSSSSESELEVAETLPASEGWLPSRPPPAAKKKGAGRGRGANLFDQFKYTEKKKEDDAFKIRKRAREYESTHSWRGRAGCRRPSP
jgi:hypothetical protein